MSADRNGSNGSVGRPRRRQVQTYLDAECFERMERLARERGISRSDFVREAVLEKLRRELDTDRG